ncbi:hypothetical protein [Neptuniibacter sp. QD37_11]|uniref:hypothetical protein n=1 Tax=Neptuniibacter sp. QD37_11 TaxID=3398209 RepID=UPI0039F4B912
MSIINQLIKKHADQLPEAQQYMLARRAEREAARVELANIPYLSRVMIKVAPKKFEQPVDLFGQKAPSLACSEITVATAIEQADGGYGPGQHLLSMLISDQNLCRLAFNTNNSEGIPLTAVTALGEQIERFENARGSAVDAVIGTVSGKENDPTSMVNDGIARFREVLNQSGAVKKSDAKAILSSINKAMQNVGVNHKFYARRIMENLAKDKVALQGEIANVLAAQLDGRTMPEALPAPEGISRVNNPIYDALCGYDTMAEREAVYSLIQLELKSLIETYGKEGDSIYLASSESYDAHGRRLWSQINHSGPVSALSKDEKDALETYVGKLCSEFNRVSNAHILEAVAHDKAPCLSVDVTRGKYGKGNSLFSEYDADFSSVFTFKFDNGYELIDEFGDTDLRANDNIMTLEIVEEDLMNALRGFANGGYVPCTMTTLAGRRVDHIDYHNAEQAEILSQAEDNNEAVEAFKVLATELTNRLEEKISNKAAKAEVSALLDEFEARYVAAMNSRLDKLEDIGQQSAALIKRDLERSVRRSLETLNLPQGDILKSVKLLTSGE